MLVPWKRSLAGLLLAVSNVAVASGASDVQALVVGVNTSDEGRAERGARDLAKAFRKMGFDVEELEGAQAGKKDFEEAVARLALRAKDARLVIFAYGGHGVQRAQENYLFPHGAALGKPSDIDDLLVPLARLSNALDALPAAKLFIVDACRTIPTAQSLASGLKKEGLADPTAQLPTNAFAAFAAPADRSAPDGSGLYSPFLYALLGALPGRGQSLPAIFDRVRAQVVGESDGQLPIPTAFSTLRPGVVLLPPVVLSAKLDNCDDVAFLFHNGVLKRSCPSSDQDSPITLVDGENELTVGVYNQKTCEGGICAWILRPAEGWHYHLELGIPGRAPLVLDPGEDHVELDGPRHGRYFLASRVTLRFDAASGSVEVVAAVPDAYRGPRVAQAGRHGRSRRVGVRNVRKIDAEGMLDARVEAIRQSWARCGGEPPGELCCGVVGLVEDQRGPAASSRSPGYCRAPRSRA